MKPPEAYAVDAADSLSEPLDSDAHLPESPLGAKAIFAGEKIGDCGNTVSNGGKNQHTVRKGFVSRRHNRSTH